MEGVNEGVNSLNSGGHLGQTFKVVPQSEMSGDIC